ncbi:hypothetical protein [Deinococcus roseus]|uniref:Uncharacterized protein n=1 Tax=Deinococcus roseus TaxID=392414 RepID=A0ABQ2DF83_9DEIO|nr:hypothetical protein [Deinococcus roseus]GGJ55659.1 hypothetical protein GCM10008938_47290 [Deinococcus roseus]
MSTAENQKVIGVSFQGTLIQGSREVIYGTCKLEAYRTPTGEMHFERSTHTTLHWDLQTQAKDANGNRLFEDTEGTLYAEPDIAWVEEHEALEKIKSIRGVDAYVLQHFGVHKFDGLNFSAHVLEGQEYLIVSFGRHLNRVIQARKTFLWHSEEEAVQFLPEGSLEDTLSIPGLDVLFQVERLSGVCLQLTSVKHPDLLALVVCQEGTEQNKAWQVVRCTVLSTTLIKQKQQTDHHALGVTVKPQLDFSGQVQHLLTQVESQQLLAVSDQIIWVWLKNMQCLEIRLLGNDWQVRQMDVLGEDVLAV